MKTIKSYECRYCGELNKEKESIKDHEKICDFNPQNRSCGSCAYLWLDEVWFDDNETTRFHTCLLNEDISNGNNKSNCPKYGNIRLRLNIAKMSVARDGYNNLPPIRRLEASLNL